MQRRRFLASAGLAVVAGGGCLSLGEPAGTEPLSGTFDPFPERASWHRTLETDAALDSHPNLAVQDDIFVAPGSRLSRLSPSGTERWSVETRTAPGALEATDAGVYYRGGGGMELSPVLAAHESSDGAERWWQEPDYHPSIVGATTDAVFVGSTTDDAASAGMPVTALGADSADQRWQAETGMTRNGVLTPKLCLVHAFPATLVAFAVESGDERWRHSFEGEINGLHLVDDGLLLPTKTGLSAVSLPAGDLRWEKSVGEKEWLATDGSESASPETVYVGGRDGQLHAIDLSSGEIRWSERPPTDDDEYGDRIVGVAHGTDRVVARTGNTLLGLDAADGTEQWRQVLSPFYDVSAPIVVGETVFLLHSPEGDEVEVRSYDSASGERRWRHSSPLTDNLLPRYAVADDRFVVATQSGDVYGFLQT